MSDSEKKELKVKIMEAIQVAAERMIRKKKQLGQKLVVEQNGIIKEIDPV